MILLFDIGNSNICIACANNNTILQKIRIKTDVDKTPDDYYQIINSSLDIAKIKAVAISSVVPSLLKTIKIMCKKYFPFQPLIVEPGIKTGVNIKTDNPSEVGADIVCDASYLAKREARGLVIDLGTCNKYVYLNKNNLEGAIISPGLVMGLKSLSTYTALLPNTAFEPSSKLLGTNTVEAIQSGVLNSLVGEIHWICEKVKAQVGDNNLAIYLTGGVSKLISPYLDKTIKYVSDLTLIGLLEIYFKNVKE